MTFKISVSFCVRLFASKVRLKTLSIRTYLHTIDVLEKTSTNSTFEIHGSTYQEMSVHWTLSILLVTKWSLWFQLFCVCFLHTLYIFSKQSRIPLIPTDTCSDYKVLGLSLHEYMNTTCDISLAFLKCLESLRLHIVGETVNYTLFPRDI